MAKILALAKGSELLSLLLLCIIALPIAAQPDYISIDCGTGREKNRTDGRGIKWTNDGSYIVSGYNSGNLITWQGNWLGELYDFRYFNESRSKFCYELPVTTNTTYLIRAGFLWANFSDLSGGPVVFDVTVMSTLWTTVEISSVTDFRTELKDGVTSPLTREIIIRSSSSVMNVCLVRKAGFPFINSLELRPLADDMYTEVTNNSVLVNQWRWTAGRCCLLTPRYPNDVYDRIWYQYDDSLRWGNSQITESVVIEEFQKSRDYVESQIELQAVTGFNQPPPDVMKDAWTVNGSLVMHFPIDGKSSEYYIALYFQEVLNVTNGSRVFDVLLNGESVGNIQTPANGLGFITLKKISGTWANITLQRTSGSILNPILNAAEMYGVLDVNSSATDPDDVNSLNAIRARLGLVDWAGDPCFPVPWDWLSCSDIQPSRVTQLKLSSFGLGGSIPLELGNLTELTDLWLDHNNLKGLIPSFSRSQKLKSLHLQNNLLHGSIPSELSGLPELQELFLDNNNLSGVVPPSLLALTNSNERNFTFTFSGNRLCLPGNESCEVDTPAPSPGDSSSKNPEPSHRLIVAIVSGTVLLALAVLIAAVILCRLYNRRKAQKMTRPKVTTSQELELDNSTKARPYSYQEVEQITSNFLRVLGSGSYGDVYHGKLPDGEEVAVKVNAANSKQGAAEFASEVALLSRVHHKYLVSLVGYCQEHSHRILIYVYMPNGSLGDHLHGHKSKDPLSWKKRLDIALNAAQGLEYLHTFCAPPIIHRDVKPNNILLDEQMVAKLADFGMSKSVSQGSQTGVSTAVKGTLGYLDPEYFTGWQRLTVKSDVYSFGVVLLELISGQKPTTVLQLEDGTEAALIPRARLVTDDMSILVDPAIRWEYQVEAIWKVYEIGMACVQPQQVDRPDMGQVVQGLIEAKRIENSTGAGVKGHLIKRKSKSVAFRDALAESTAAPLKRYSMDSIATWDSETSSAFNPR